jgi:hypothetical protein
MEQWTAEQWKQFTSGEPLVFRAMEKDGKLWIRVQQFKPDEIYWKDILVTPPLFDGSIPVNLIQKVFAIMAKVRESPTLQKLLGLSRKELSA